MLINRAFDGIKLGGGRGVAAPEESGLGAVLTQRGASAHDRSQRGAVAHYADLVMEARRKRRLVDNGVIDWVMVRNRMASIASNNARQIAVSIGRLAGELRFRVADGLHDRVIFRELFPIGLTALDPIEDASAGPLTASQQSARREIEDLVTALDLPAREPGVEYLDSRRSWHARVAHHYDRAGGADPLYGLRKLTREPAEP